MQIYVQRDGQQAGPYSPEHLRQELAAGTLRATDLAWYEGAPGWLPLAAVPGLNAGAPFPMPAAPYAVGMPPAPRTSGLAVTSLILGILGLLSFGLTSLPAVICGHLSLSQAKRSAGRIGGQGMAVTGLVTGYVSMLLFVVLVGLAVPVYSSVATKGKVTKGLAQAKQIGLSCKLYAADNDGKFPKTLDELIPDYMTNRQLFVCPLDDTKAPMGYDYFGGTDDDPHRVLLRSKATTHDGKRIVIHVDNAGELAKD